MIMISVVYGFVSCASIHPSIHRFIGYLSQSNPLTTDPFGAHYSPPPPSPTDTPPPTQGPLIIGHSRSSWDERPEVAMSSWLSSRWIPVKSGPSSLSWTVCGGVPGRYCVFLVGQYLAHSLIPSHPTSPHPNTPKQFPTESDPQGNVNNWRVPSQENQLSSTPTLNASSLHHQSTTAAATNTITTTVTANKVVLNPSRTKQPDKVTMPATKANTGRG